MIVFYGQTLGSYYASCPSLFNILCANLLFFAFVNRLILAKYIKSQILGRYCEVDFGKRTFDLDKTERKSIESLPNSIASLPKSMWKGVVSCVIVSMNDRI